MEARPLTRADALATYRYLRIGMVGAVGWLAVAVLVEIVRDGFTVLPSISAYWYTPVRGVFVGTLVAIGLSLIVIKGTNPWEDTFLNFAGLFAPIVALVPTVLPGQDNLVDPVVLAQVDNNITSLLVIAPLGIAFAWVLLPRGRWPEARSAAHLGLLGAAAIYLVTLVTFVFFRETFTRWAHDVAAIGMFVSIAVAVFITARQDRLRDERLRPTYMILSTVMVVTIVAVVAARIAGTDWEHLVLAVEVIEIVAFAIFWILQTREHWDEASREGTDGRHAPHIVAQR